MVKVASTAFSGKLDLEVEGRKGISAASQVHDCRECVGGDPIGGDGQKQREASVDVGIASPVLDISDMKVEMSNNVGFKELQGLERDFIGYKSTYLGDLLRNECL